MKIISAVTIGALTLGFSIATARADTATAAGSIELGDLVPEEVKTEVAPIANLAAPNNLSVELKIDELAGEGSHANSQVWSYRRLDNGLTNLVKQGIGSKNSDNVLTVCGLIDIITVRQTRMSRVVAFPIPIIESSNTDSVRKYGSLKADIAAICAPRADSSFSIEGTVLLDMNFSGTGGERTINQRLDEKTSCHVGATPSPASTLVPGLTGDYLRVSCETSWSKLPAVRSEFVFLKDLGLYFPLSRDISPTIRSSFKIKHVDLMSK